MKGKKALIDYDGTMIIVSHDRDFLAELTNKTLEFRDKKLNTYLGDVNFFLEKRAMANMREVEMRTNQKNKYHSRMSMNGRPYPERRR